MPASWTEEVAAIEQGQTGWEAILLGLMEQIRTEGGVFVVKVDGERLGDDALPVQRLNPLIVEF